jgi:hypothetical protein
MRHMQSSDDDDYDKQLKPAIKEVTLKTKLSCFSFKCINNCWW